MNVFCCSCCERNDGDGDDALVFENGMADGAGTDALPSLLEPVDMSQLQFLLLLLLIRRMAIVFCCCCCCCCSRVRLYLCMTVLLVVVFLLLLLLLWYLLLLPSLLSRLQRTHAIYSPCCCCLFGWVFSSFLPSFLPLPRFFLIPKVLSCRFRVLGSLCVPFLGRLSLRPTISLRAFSISFALSHVSSKDRSFSFKTELPETGKVRI